MGQGRRSGERFLFWLEGCGRLVPDGSPCAWRCPPHKRYLANDTGTHRPIHWRNPEPPCKGVFYSFFRCPVLFGSTASRILFARSDLDCPLPATNLDLACANDRIFADFLDKLQGDDLVSRVKAIIVQELVSGSPSDGAVAQVFSTSSRTLQRRLAARGTTYYQLLDAVRYQLAERYIADPSRSLKEISFLLGFSGPPAFSRAFRRWTGQAPIAVRDAATD